MILLQLRSTVGWSVWLLVKEFALTTMPTCRGEVPPEFSPEFSKMSGMSSLSS